MLMSSWLGLRGLEGRMVDTLLRQDISSCVKMLGGLKLQTRIAQVKKFFGLEFGIKSAQ